MTVITTTQVYIIYKSIASLYFTVVTVKKPTLLLGTHMMLPLLGSDCSLSSWHRALLSKMSCGIATSPSSLRVRLLDDSKEIVILFVFLPERVCGEAMLFCPVRSTIVIGHDLREFVKDLFIWHRLSVRSGKAIILAAIARFGRRASSPVLYDSNICRLASIAR